LLHDQEMTLQLSLVNGYETPLQSSESVPQSSRPKLAFTCPNILFTTKTHLDALWEMADLIAGEEIQLTPTEAFVLGGAFLIHDLGMGLAAYPEGRTALRQDPGWSDVVAALLTKKLGRAPSAGERSNPDESIEVEATTELLRLRHAERAENLAKVSWSSSDGKDTYYLIENPELRSAFGSAIGQIAHSHWWTIEEVRQKFSDSPQLRAPAYVDMPRTWTVNQLKLACLLRGADEVV